MALLEAAHLTVRYQTGQSLFRKPAAVTALDDVSLSLDRGKATAVIGESGSGKTTLGRALCRLLSPETGTVLIDGKDIRECSRQELSRRIQMVFQDPFASLNPRLSIGTMLEEAAGDHPSDKRAAIVRETLTTVGLSADIIPLYPHQFSGGQRQRIAIARALIKQPDIIVADEPLSSLDISIQNQLLQLFVSLKKERGIAFVFISHDLVTAGILADHIIVMKDGRVVEEGTPGRILGAPEHPYTQRLRAAIPLLECDAN